ncbi:unnamed protein product [Strongylus vulgaris]|uniref:Serine carboxypeptidase S28 n=1 Tax=Strongylus vulgaris TaxID=40348 RepID=A0A3P7I436_STRVU|nr:unnamed protein product [Strongylus vulgaris]
MYPLSPNDKPDLATARNLIMKNIKTWLGRRLNRKNEISTVTQWMRPKERAPLAIEKRRFYPKQPIELTKKSFPEWNHYKKVFLGRPPHGFLPPPDKPSHGPPIEYESGFFTQPFDHFDNQNPNSFHQRFFKNAHWAQPGGPNFLKIGGESVGNSAWVLNEELPYLKWAKTYGATVHLLEHRYYGDSIVGGTEENPNPDLKYLSSIQMLYDVKDYIESNSHSNNSGPWIVFGGSYAGSCS